MAAFLGTAAVVPLACGNSNSNPSSPSSPGPSYTYPFLFPIGDYGTPGSANGQFGSFSPHQLAVYQNAIYVVDNGNKRLEQFSLNGYFMQSQAVAGASLGLFGLAVSGGGTLYVSDYTNGTITRFSSSLTNLGALSTSIPLTGPQGLAFDGNNHLYITDGSAEQLLRCDFNGANCMAVGSIPATAVGNFNNPVAVAVDASGNVYVADYGNNRIQKFNSSLASPSVIIGPGTASGSVSQPYAIAVDGDGNLLVTDYASPSGRVQKFTPSGSYLTSFAFPPPQTSVGSLEGLAVDSAKNVYVSDSSSAGVLKFAPY